MRPLSISTTGIIFLFASLFFANQAFAQVAIGTATPDPDAVLLLMANGNQGLIIPRVTNISTVPTSFGKKGMLAYDNATDKVYFHNGTGWGQLGATGSGSQGISIQGNLIQIGTGPGFISSLPLSSPAPTALDKGSLFAWDGAKWSITPRPTTSGQILKWDNSTGVWVLGTDVSGGAAALPNNQIFVGNTSSVATAVPMSGDAGIDNTGKVTISNTAGANIVSSINSSASTVGTAVTVAHGGTGATTLSGVLAGTGTTPVLAIPNGSPNQVLTMSGGIPSWQNSAAGGVTSVTATTPLNAGGTASAPNIDFPSWPANASGVLTNNGAGILTWAASGGGFSSINAIPKGDGSTLVASTITDDGTTVEVKATSPKLSIRSTSGVSTTAASSLEFTNALSGLVGSISDTGSSDHLQISSFVQGLLFNTNFNTRMAIDNNGNVGIGTISPISKLDVAGDLHLAQIPAPAPVTDKLYNVGGNLFWNGTNISSGGSGWNLTGNGGTNPATNFLGTTDAQPLIIKNGGSESMRINSGYASLGGRTTAIAASSAFDVQTDMGSGLGGMYVDANDPQGSPFYGYSKEGVSQAYTYIDGNNGSWKVFNNGSDRFTVSSAGNVGIGTTSPQEKLTLFNTSDAGLAVNSYGSFGGAASTARIVLQASTGLFIAPGMSREWTIGTSSTTSNNLDISARTASNVLPAREFTFSPTAFFAANDNSNSLGLSSNRWTTVFAVNGTINTSDARLKENVQNINYGLNEVMRLRPVSYNWKTGAKYMKLGLIAQETEKIIPEVVSKPQEKDGYYGIMYSDLIPVLIKAIQEQQKTIDTLSEQNKALKEKELKFEASLVKQEGEMTALKKQMEEVLRIVGAEAKKK